MCKGKWNQSNHICKGKWKQYKHMCKGKWKKSKHMCKGKWKQNLLNMWILFNFIRGKVPLFCKYTPDNIKADQSQII
jgi:hypothetical protein